MKKKGTSIIKKGLSGLLTLSMVASMSGTAPCSVAASVSEEYDVALHYDMTAENGYLVDKSGNGNNGKVHNIEDSAFSKEAEDTILALPGNSGSYVDIPLSVVENLTDYKDGFSVEMALIPQTYQHQFVWTLGTGDANNYLFMNPSTPTGDVNSAIKTDGVEETLGGGETLDRKSFSVITVTSEGDTLKVYINGVEKNTLKHTRDLGQIFAGNGTDILGWIGKSNWGADPYCDAIISDFKIYNQTLTGQEVKSIYDNSNYVYASQLMKEDLEAIDLGNMAAVTEDLLLPSKGSLHDSTITWASNNTDVLKDDGKVTSAEQTTVVTLTATCALHGMTITKDFQIYVIGTADKKQVAMDQYLIVPYYLSATDELPMEVLGYEVSWESDSPIVDTNTGKITPTEEGVTEVALTATVEGTTKEFKVNVLGTDAAYVLGYTREADAKNNDMYNEFESYSMHLGYSEDGEAYEALLNNTGVLFAKAAHPETKLLQDPYIFRMKDGSFGVLAVRVNVGEVTADAVGEILFFTSKDLISYEEVDMIHLSDTEYIENPACNYDAVDDEYRITWTSLESGLTFVNTTKDFETFTDAKASTPLTITSAATEIPYAVECNVIAVTAAEKTRILNKLGKVTNTTVDVPTISTIEGTPVDVERTKVTANYSDGSKADKTVIWDAEDLAAIDFNTPGTYMVEGIIKQLSDQTEDNYPFLASRADPAVTEYNGKYYFVATTEDEGGIGIYIRESDTVTGLNKVEQHLIFDIEKGTEYGLSLNYNHWAPELHVVDGELYMFFSSQIGEIWNVQSMLMKLTGTDPTNYDHWGNLEIFLDPDGRWLGSEYGGITLDMTYFTYADRHYVCWSQRDYGKNGGTADLWIGEIDIETPYKLIADPVKIVNCEYGWERNNQLVLEGPNFILTDDKLYLTYSGAATDITYCVGLVTIELDENTNFLDPASWKKNNYPILTTNSVEGYNGPGHNKYVIDEDGNLINVFHARAGFAHWRDAFLRIVHMGADGEPILDMVEEREILPENKNITLTVIVSSEIPDPTPTPTPTPVVLPFEDVTEEDPNYSWFGEGIKSVYEQGIMGGYTDTKFAPYENITRADFALTLYRIAEQPAVTYDDKFPDVAEDAYYADAVIWASEKGIVTGFEDGKFHPTDKISRQDMVVMLYRYEGKPVDEATGDYSSFTDADDVYTYASDAIKWAMVKGLLKGNADGTLLPQKNITRAEIAVILDRFIG